MYEQQVAIIGSGLMGSGIAQVSATAGYNTMLYDINVKALSTAKERIHTLLNRKVEKAKLSSAEASAIEDNLLYITDIKELVQADIIIEAVPEDFSLKCKVLSSLAQDSDQNEAIIVTNTSSFNIDDLAACVAPERFMGLHFFYPAPVMKLIELIPGSYTSDATFNAMSNFAESLGKIVVVAPNQPGFIVNRLIVPFENEAAYLVMEGADPTSVDTAMKFGCNHPMGPLELLDFTGIDTVYSAMNNLYREFGDKKYKPCPLLKEMIDTGRLGKKSGRGFYEY